MKFNSLILALVIASLLVVIIPIQMSALGPEPTHSEQRLSSRGAISNPTEITYPIHHQIEKMPDKGSRPHSLRPIDDIEPSGPKNPRYFWDDIDHPCGEENILGGISQDQPCGHAWGG